MTAPRGSRAQGVGAFPQGKYAPNTWRACVACVPTLHPDYSLLGFRVLFSNPRGCASFLALTIPSKARTLAKRLVYACGDSEPWGRLSFRRPAWVRDYRCAKKQAALTAWLGGGARGGGSGTPLTHDDGKRVPSFPRPCKAPWDGPAKKELIITNLSKAN